MIAISASLVIIATRKQWRDRMIRMQPRVLWFLMLSYSMALVFANWFAARLITFNGFTTDGGTLLFPLTFIITDMITEVYGYKHARRAIWAGFLFNVLFLAYGHLISLFPSPDYYQSTSGFDQVISVSGRIVLASLVSYLCAEPLNIYLVAKMKIWSEGRKMALRFVLSTAVSAAIDTTIFCSLAFGGIVPMNELIMFMVTMWGLKVVIEVIGLPFSVRLAKYLKKYEQLDIYDNHTEFTLLSLDGAYSSSANHIVDSSK